MFARPRANGKSEYLTPRYDPPVLLFFVACAASVPTPPGAVEHDFARTATDFWAAPHPSAHRLGPTGTVDLAAFPNPDGTPLVADLLSLLHGRATGFSTTAGVGFRLRAPLDPASLPTLLASIEPDAPLFLAELSPQGILRRVPVDSRFEADGGPFGDSNLLTLLPLQGLPLAPGARHVAVLTTALRLANGTTLPAWPGAATLLAGGCPEGLAPAPCAEYRAALVHSGLPASSVAGLTAFTTADPQTELLAFARFAREQNPAPPPEDLSLVESFDDYCVFEGSTAMPVYQSGEAPYLSEGGEILLAQDGSPALDHWETARVVLTLPRAAPPEGGFPLAMMIRTGGGGERSLVDRGERDATGTVLVPGSGMARTFAAAGFAGLSIDGPHGGLRNVSGGDEQFLIFNIANPAAMRDNLRQSAIEISLWPALAAGLALPEGCPDQPSPRLDLSTLALVGHSMGATIAPLAASLSPEVRALVLSGAGGSWIENVVHKQSPLQVRPIAEAILGYDGRELHAFDPALNLLQWAGESADPPVWGAQASQGRDILVLQGIVDTYILPPMANALALSHGLDLGGESLDAAHPELQVFRPLEELLPLVGGEVLPLPVQANRDGRTRVVVQHREDGVEDGHEVMFQVEAARAQVEGFLRGLAAGEPVVED